MIQVLHGCVVFLLGLFPMEHAFVFCLVWAIFTGLDGVGGARILRKDRRIETSVGMSLLIKLHVGGDLHIWIMDCVFNQFYLHLFQNPHNALQTILTVKFGFHNSELICGNAHLPPKNADKHFIFPSGSNWTKGWQRGPRPSRLRGKGKVSVICSFNNSFSHSLSLRHGR